MTKVCHHFANQLKLDYSVSLMGHFFLLWKVIAKARVPIVKFVERNSGIAFDIRLNFVSSLLMYFLFVLVSLFNWINGFFHLDLLFMLPLFR
jgi:hypothetical protein